MGFFSHLFHPWGFVVQIAALVHFFWRRRASFVWLWIIFIGGSSGPPPISSLTHGQHLGNARLEV